ncbi:uncharacterized protein DFL_009138 [Arthrobotrys flagrans]|uniref:JmjC domain-containing protein n=1 Tax=Arthrobotrys flagrans TaxID=97331 RepID=A0A436ZQT8_ARTFL|nr:hypothetical protein DFL_009138 [Arthrobotrys flagrans]
MAPRQEAAPFVPISPTINIPLLVSSTPNFKSVQRIDARRINPTNIESLQAMIHEHVVLRGIPIVIENWHLRSDWPKWIFSIDWLRSNHGTDQVNIRDIPNKVDIPMTLGHYLNNMSKLTSKFTPSNYDGQQQRLYGKDLDCPPVWRSGLANIIPESTFYLSTRADLMSSLPKDARAENMMCYVGHEGTYTPAHMEMCATLGQNIMIAASQEGPNSEKGGSLWFMTQMADREAVAEYWTGTLGHDLSVEAHFASIEDLQAAPFTVFVLEQKVGDYVLVPPLAPHQVWNRGTTTVKAAWNRVTVDTLEHALREALPKIRLVCRDEQYKTKAIVYDTLGNYAKALTKDDESEMKLFPPMMKDDFIRLYNLFTSILINECFSPLLPKETKVEMIPNEYNITCSFCRGNIFNRFLSCKRCPPSMQGLEDDPYDICMECYARGRSCFCVSGLSWVEQHPWVDLLTNHEKFREMVVKILKEKEKAKETPEEIAEPPRFPDALANMSKERKGLARVCQEALQTRPYLDPNTIDELDDEKEIAKKKKEGKLLNCHTCGYRHPNWKVMLCTNKDCGKAYCFGNLWRAYDMDPFDDCLAKHHWKCPVCLGFCACGRCRRRPNHTPYTPKGTILGLTTKHVADVRSIESLVDFSKGNVGWLQNGVSGGKPSSQDGGENRDAISKWGSTFGATDGIEPDAVGQAEDPVFPAEFNDRNVVAMPAGYKPHFSAAGLDVVSIPIDPALKMSEYMDPSGSSKREQNGDYLKRFENPPDIPISLRRYHRPEHSGITPLHSDGIEPAQRNDVHESNINPALIDGSSAAQGYGSQIGGAHEHQSWGVRLQDAPTPGLLTLEKDLLAFLAAAGLRHFQQEEQGVDDYGNPYHDSYHNYGEQVLHPTETFGGSDDGQDAPSEPYGLIGASHHYQPNLDLALEGGKAKGKSKKQSLSKKERRERVQGDLEYETVEKGTVADWVLDRTKKGKKRKGTLIVRLKISPDAWGRYNAKIAKEKEEKAQKLAAKLGFDDVGTDLTPNPKRRRLDGVAGSPASRKRGRPQGSRKIYADLSEDEADGGRLNELLSDDEQEVMPKKSSRSTRTGELVDGLTFEPTRKTPLNKSSRPPPANGSSLKPLFFKSKSLIDLEANSPVACDDDDDDDGSIGPSTAVSKKQTAKSGAELSGYNQAEIDKALRDAKRMALAAAEGRSPPPLSVYSSEAQSRAGSEDEDEDEPSFQVVIGSKRPARNKDGSEDEGPMSPVVGDIRIPPAVRNVVPKTPTGPNRKPGPRPSRPLSKRGRPGRPKKADVYYVAPRSTKLASSNGFTPINNPAAPASVGSAKRGRPRRDSNANGIASPNVNSTPAASPPAKRPRRGLGTPNKPTAVDTTSKIHGRPRKSLSTPTKSATGAASLTSPSAKASATKNSTPKKKPGRPSRSSLSRIDISASKSAKAAPLVPIFNPAGLDASRSRNVIELMSHSPLPGGDDEDDDWL